jgi:hypothetical protein
MEASGESARLWLEEALDRRHSETICWLRLLSLGLLASKWDSPKSLELGSADLQGRTPSLLS